MPQPSSRGHLCPRVLLTRQTCARTLPAPPTSCKTTQGPAVPLPTPPASASGKPSFHQNALLTCWSHQAGTVINLRFETALEGSELEAFLVLLPQRPRPRAWGGPAPAPLPNSPTCSPTDAPQTFRGSNTCSEITSSGTPGKHSASAKHQTQKSVPDTARGWAPGAHYPPSAQRRPGFPALLD